MNVPSNDTEVLYYISLSRLAARSKVYLNTCVFITSIGHRTTSLVKGVHLTGTHHCRLNTC